MSTIVYQELQPCSESYFTESRILSLKLTSPKINTSQTCSNNNTLEHYSSKFEYGSKTASSSNSSTCSWSEIESLTTKRNTITNQEKVYVHPLVKNSSFKLSQKSLEMCTESLGSETGCFSTENSDFLPFIKTENKRKSLEKLTKKRELFKNHGNFPPPITTLRGSSPLCVKQLREDGRLIIEAIRTPPIQSYMQAERSEGRLKLSIMREYYSHDDDNNDNDNDNDNCDDCETLRNEEVGNYKLEECNTNSDEYFLEEMKGITIEFGASLDVGKLQRASRCKEGVQRSKRLINWEPFWVAT